MIWLPWPFTLTWREFELGLRRDENPLEDWMRKGRRRNGTNCYCFLRERKRKTEGIEETRTSIELTAKEGTKWKIKKIKNKEPGWKKELPKPKKNVKTVQDDEKNKRERRCEKSRKTETTKAQQAEKKNKGLKERKKLEKEKTRKKPKDEVKRKRKKLKKRLKKI